MASHYDRKDALVGGIEAGGTKFVCGVGVGPQGGLLARAEFPTGYDPDALLPELIDWFEARQREHGRLEAIGIASFGPVDLDPASPAYGHITSTPKPGWRNADLAGPLGRAFAGIPVGFDTDTNGAALGEFFWGRAAGLDDFIYITIGTGIGAGGMARGQLLHGLVHPEMGHIRLPRAAGDEFAGVCPYHGACWEGLCSGPAMKARTGMGAEDLPAEHEAWLLEAHYVALAIANIVCVLSPRVVILGGSIRKAGRLGEGTFFRLVRENVQTALNGYVVSPALVGDAIGDYIVPPGLGDDAGVWGAIALGQCAIPK